MRAAGRAAGVFAVCLIASSASAHLGHIVLNAERYLKIDIGDAKARVVVSLTLGPGEGQRVLEAADEDADGTVTRAEADAYMSQWGKGLETDLPVRVNGEPVPVRWGQPFISPIGAVEPKRVNVEMVAEVPLEAGVHRVSIRDRMRVEAFDRTDVVLGTHGQARLVAAGMGEEPDGITRALAFGKDLPTAQEGLVLTAVAEVPGPPNQGQPWWVWVCGATAILIGAASWIAVRRQAAKD